MIIPEGKVFKTDDGRTWFAVECFTEQLEYRGEPGPYMTWMLFNDKGERISLGYLYKTARYHAGLNAAKRAAKRAAIRDWKKALKEDNRVDGFHA